MSRQRVQSSPSSHQYALISGRSMGRAVVMATARTSGHLCDEQHVFGGEIVSCAMDVEPDDYVTLEASRVKLFVGNSVTRISVPHATKFAPGAMA